ncbi:type I-E CRISPR-associated protein Cse1/CasA [Streptomyces buecherae]|uniref:type I-E CRISPR-associated protein Cse1/CasA n=1 Tax=Streptomyces buecherae TaxID=2763006 RepID=UPI0018E0A55C|nr:type I-E CRISPR-associated protein Cse1/CasA [Streptomyces buecherae]
MLDEPWLLARTADQGEAAGAHAGAQSAERAVGVRELLLDAHRFRDIEVDIPTQKPAIFRQLLLPLVVDALGFPKDAADWAKRFARGAFSDAEREGLVRYFDTYGGHFDLFSETDPFAQVAGLRTAKGETKTSALLVATAAQGNNVPLFSSRTDADPLELTPAEAARWLLHTHCWDTGAIKTGVEGDGQAKGGKTTGNPVGPLGQLGVVMPRGTTFYETLLLNVPYGKTRRKSDLPQWRRREREGGVTGSTATPSWQTRPAEGPLETWTWQARRVLLVREQAADGSERVTRAVVAAGDRLSQVSQDHETHTAWRHESPVSYARRKGKAAEVPQIRPLRHRVGRAAWRGLDALLAVDRRSSDPTKAPADQHTYITSELLKQLSTTRQDYDTPASDYALQLEMTGIAYSSKLGSIEDLFFDEMPLPLAALDREGRTRGALLGAVSQAEQLSLAVNRLGADLRRAAGSDPLPRGAWEYPGEALLHALDPLVRVLLVDLREADEDFDKITARLVEWEERAGKETWKVAEQLLSNAAAPGLFQGRVVTRGDTSRVYRLSEAEAAFRKSLDKILWQRAERRAERRAEERRARAAEAEVEAEGGEAEAQQPEVTPEAGSPDAPDTSDAPDTPDTPDVPGPDPDNPTTEGLSR